MQANLSEEEIRKQEEELRKKRLAEEIEADFRARREARRKTENGWTLNLQFVEGNQYCDMTPAGAL